MRKLLLTLSILLLSSGAFAQNNANSLSIRSNILHDILLMPSIGVEYQINSNLGFKLDGSFSGWGGETGNVQKIWMFSPEARWYLSSINNLYVGLGCNFAKYNTYGYLLGKLWPESIGYRDYEGETGYQGKLWNLGATVGYKLPISSIFTIDFNLGLGYINSKYDSFNVIKEVRVYNKMEQTKNTFGLTQLGITLVWTIL